MVQINLTHSEDIEVEDFSLWLFAKIWRGVTFPVRRVYRFFRGADVTMLAALFVFSAVFLPVVFAVVFSLVAA